MRIAFFHSTLPEPDRKVGGVEVFVHRLANRLVGRGHSVTMFTLAPQPPVGASYRTVRIGAPDLGTNKAARLTVAPWLLNRIDTEPFDVMHLHGDDWFFVRRGVPTVRTFYGSAWFEAASATSWKRTASQAAVYPLEVIASHLATVSFDIGSPLPLGYRTAGSLPLAVEEPAVTPLAVSGGAERKVILFVGTWEGRKRGAFLADLFRRDVLRQHPTAELIMVSDRCVEAAGIRWVRFPTDTELSALFSEATIFCMPSTYEGFGLPYLEAMAHGIPVVATPNRGASHVLAGGAGVIASDSELAGAINQLLADPDRRERLRTLGLARAKDFAWDRVLARHEAAYTAARDAVAG